jgi:hypothetical protein
VTSTSPAPDNNLEGQLRFLVGGLRSNLPEVLCRTIAAMQSLLLWHIEKAKPYLPAIMEVQSRTLDQPSVQVDCGKFIARLGIDCPDISEKVLSQLRTATEPSFLKGFMEGLSLRVFHSQQIPEKIYSAVLDHAGRIPNDQCLSVLQFLTLVSDAGSACGLAFDQNDPRVSSLCKRDFSELRSRVMADQLMLPQRNRCEEPGAQLEDLAKLAVARFMADNLTAGPDGLRRFLGFEKTGFPMLSASEIVQVVNAIRDQATSPLEQYRQLFADGAKIVCASVDFTSPSDIEKQFSDLIELVESGSITQIAVALEPELLARAKEFASRPYEANGFPFSIQGYTEPESDRDDYALAQNRCLHRLMHAALGRAELTFIGSDLPDILAPELRAERACAEFSAHLAQKGRILVLDYAVDVSRCPLEDGENTLGHALVSRFGEKQVRCVLDISRSMIEEWNGMRVNNMVNALKGLSHSFGLPVEGSGLERLGWDKHGDHRTLIGQSWDSIIVRDVKDFDKDLLHLSSPREGQRTPRQPILA